MKIGFLVNDVTTEQVGYTTTRLGCEAINQGHEVYVFGVGDLAYDSDEFVRARARTVPKKSYGSHEGYFRDLQGPKAVSARITVDDLDVLMLRNVPSDDFIKRPWATTAATEFGRVAMRRGVIVVNDPNGLAKASSKIYLQLFPEEVRPRTLITRDHKEIKAFAKQEGTIVLKPLQGSGGASVFLVRPDDVPNINQMIDAVSRDGFVIAQEYLPAAAEGDMRLFMMNGRPLRVKGKYAAFRRVRKGDDMRSNIHAGGRLAEAQVTDEALRLAEIVRPNWCRTACSWLVSMSSETG
jgi:glutathione synthase